MEIVIGLLPFFLNFVLGDADHHRMVDAVFLWSHASPARGQDFQAGLKGQVKKQNSFSNAILIKKL